MLEASRRFHYYYPMRGRRRWILGVGALLTAALVYAGCFATPPGPRSIAAFDPDRTAALDLDMWQAYYAKRNVRLFRGLVTLLHAQNRYPWSKAARAGRLRDDGGDHADWAAVSQLLVESYRALHAAVQTR